MKPPIIHDLSFKSSVICNCDTRSDKHQADPSPGVVGRMGKNSGREKKIKKIYIFYYGSAFDLTTTGLASLPAWLTPAPRSWIFEGEATKCFAFQSLSLVCSQTLIRPRRGRRSSELSLKITKITIEQQNWGFHEKNSKRWVYIQPMDEQIIASDE